jgi:uncharacterized damage-inducible protein DinB
MSMMEAMAGQVQWAGSNLAYNLKFIPEDKLNWKPAPEALSALEIVNHVAQPLIGMRSYLDGGEFKADFEPATDLKSAQELVRSASAAYAEKLRSLAPQDLEGTIQMPFGGEWPKARAATLPVIDLTHHHGQIVYIQSLLGDTESHFEEMGN